MWIVWTAGWVEPGDKVNDGDHFASAYEIGKFLVLCLYLHKLDGFRCESQKSVRALKKTSED